MAHTSWTADRAVALLPRRHQLTGQLPLLAVMVFFTAGGLYLWAIVIYLFCTRFAARHGESAGDAGPLGRGPGEEIYALRPMREGVIANFT